MARYKEAVCRLCRREGRKLFLKGERCLGPKCSVSKHSYPPGEHGLRRGRKISTYGEQLREKQKAKRMYGVLEQQFRRYFRLAERYKGVTGTILLQLLERRLDNIVYRMGYAPSRASARQLVRHGHIRVNGRRVDIPSYLVRVGEELALPPKVLQNKMVMAALEGAGSRGRPAWLRFSEEEKTGSLLAVPSREEIPVELREQLIVELYSK